MSDSYQAASFARAWIIEMHSSAWGRPCILMVLAAGMRLDGLVDFAKVAKRTPVSLPAAFPRGIIPVPNSLLRNDFSRIVRRPVCGCIN
jgi:hypothetical protein